MPHPSRGLLDPSFQFPLSVPAGGIQFPDLRCRMSKHTRGSVDRMNKADFIGAVSAAADLSRADAGRAVDAMIDVIKKALKKGDTISLVGFGTFTVRSRAARSGRNPRTGQTINIEASKNPTFKAGKALKDAVN